MQQTPIFVAILSGNIEIVSIILEWPRFNIRCPDNLGFSPFSIACMKGDVRCENIYFLLMSDLEM